MTKRILALLLAVLLMCTMFVGCLDKKDDKDDEAAEKAPVTPKTQLIDGLAQTLFGQSGMDFTVPELSGDMLGEIQLKLNQLTVGTTDYLEKGPIELNGGISLDGDSSLMELNASANWMGENPTVKAVVSEQGVYVTDLLGVNDKPILATFSDLKMDASKISEAFSTASAASAAGQAVLDAVLESLEKNIPDSAFVADTQDVELNGNAFQDATVITMTVTTEMMENIVVDIATALQSNQAVSSLLGNKISAEEIKGQLGQGELVVAGTIADGKAVALDANLTVDGNEVFALNGSFLPTGSKVSLVSKAKELFVIETVMDGDNVTATLSVDKKGELITPIKAEGTYKDGQFDGTVTVDVDGQSVSVKCSAGATENGANISITEIGMTMDGMNISLPVELTIATATEGSKQTVNMTVKFEYAGMLSIDAALSYSVQLSDVTVSPVNDAVSMNEVDAMTLADSVMTKYPNIAGWVSDMMMKAMENAVSNDALAF